MTILIIEDEKKLVEILKQALKIEHYATDVAFDGQEGLSKALKNNYDLIILDIMLPKKDGIEVCKSLRMHNIYTPIIMLTARGQEEDRVIGLNIGADDYLIKPFGMNELFARIRAIMRRRKTTDSNIFKIDDLVMDKVKHEVTRAGKILELTPKEYKLLDTLSLHKGEAISREQLIKNAWSPDFKEAGNELNVHIRYLRKKIDKLGQKPLIHTIRGVGFMMKE
ncbi:MAG: response regulator transcription factor [bacterium]